MYMEKNILEPTGVQIHYCLEPSAEFQLNWNISWTLQALKAQSEHVILLAVLVAINKRGAYKQMYCRIQ